MFYKSSFPSVVVIPHLLLDSDITGM